MSWADSGQSNLLLGFESTYGTTPGTPASKKVPFDSVDLGVNDPPIYVETIGNGLANPTIPGYGNKDDRGSVIIPVELVAMGWWLKLLLGAPNTTGTGPYTHVFKKSNTSPASGFVEVGLVDVAQYYLHNGVKPDIFNIGFGQNRILTARMDLLCSKETHGTSTVDGSPTDISTPSERLTDADISVEEGGSEVTSIEQLSITFENRLESSFGLSGAGIRTACMQKKARVHGNLTAIFEDDTLLTKGRNHTESSLKATLTSGSYSLEFFLPELNYSYKSPALSGPAGTRINLDFEAYYQNHADATAFKVTLINGQASYA